MEANDTLDVAQWQRFSNRGGRCLVCRRKAQVGITLTSTAIDGSRGGKKLATENVQLCGEHGLDRYASALSRLHGSSKVTVA
jgi:hypothetical protein